MVVPSGRFSISMMMLSLLGVRCAVSEGFDDRVVARTFVVGFVTGAVDFEGARCCGTDFFVGLRVVGLLLCGFMICLLRASLATAHAVTVRSPEWQWRRGAGLIGRSLVPDRYSNALLAEEVEWKCGDELALNVEPRWGEQAPSLSDSSSIPNKFAGFRLQHAANAQKIHPFRL